MKKKNIGYKLVCPEHVVIYFKTLEAAEKGKKLWQERFPREELSIIEESHMPDTI